VTWAGTVVGGALLAHLGGDDDWPPPALISLALLLVWLATLLAGVLILLLPAIRNVRRSLVAAKRRRKDRWERNNSEVLVGGLTFALVIFAFLMGEAIVGSDDVVRGGAARARLFPWKALPAQVAWKPGAAKAKLTDRCAELRLLGVGNGEIVLFDTELDRTCRVPIADATVATSVGCLWIREVSAYTSGRRCSHGRCSWNVHSTITTSHSDSLENVVVQKRYCADDACTYRPAPTRFAPVMRLPDGHYRLKVTSSYRGETARQTTNFDVP
jgi:hypothetical protein